MRALMQGDPHLRPWEVSKLTLAEVVTYLEDRADDKPERRDVKGYAAWLRSLSSEDLLEHAIQGTL